MLVGGGEAEVAAEGDRVELGDDGRGRQRRRRRRPVRTEIQNRGSLKEVGITVLIGYYDYLGTRPKNSHRPIIVTGR